MAVGRVHRVRRSWVWLGGVGSGRVGKVQRCLMAKSDVILLVVLKVNQKGKQLTCFFRTLLTSKVFTVPRTLGN